MLIITVRVLEGQGSYWLEKEGEKPRLPTGTLCFAAWAIKELVSLEQLLEHTRERAREMGISYVEGLDPLSPSSISSAA